MLSPRRCFIWKLCLQPALNCLTMYGFIQILFSFYQLIYKVQFTQKCKLIELGKFLAEYGFSSTPKNPKLWSNSKFPKRTKARCDTLSLQSNFNIQAGTIETGISLMNHHRDFYLANIVYATWSSYIWLYVSIGAAQSGVSGMVITPKWMQLQCNGTCKILLLSFIAGNRLHTIYRSFLLWL